MEAEEREFSGKQVLNENANLNCLEIELNKHCRCTIIHSPYIQLQFSHFPVEFPTQIPRPIYIF